MNNICEKAECGPVTVGGLLWIPTGARHEPRKPKPYAIHPPWEKPTVSGERLPPGGYYHGSWVLFYYEGEGWAMQPLDARCYPSGPLFYGDTPEGCLANVRAFCDSAPGAPPNPTSW